MSRHTAADVILSCSSFARLVAVVSAAVMMVMGGGGGEREGGCYFSRMAC